MLPAWVVCPTPLLQLATALASGAENAGEWSSSPEVLVLREENASPLVRASWGGQQQAERAKGSQAGVSFWACTKCGACEVQTDRVWCRCGNGAAHQIPWRQSSSGEIRAKVAILAIFDELGGVWSRVPPAVCAVAWLQSVQWLR